MRPKKEIPAKGEKRQLKNAKTDTVGLWEISCQILDIRPVQEMQEGSGTNAGSLLRSTRDLQESGKGEKEGANFRERLLSRFRSDKMTIENENREN